MDFSNEPIKKSVYSTQNNLRDFDQNQTGPGFSFPQHNPISKSQLNNYDLDNQSMMPMGWTIGVQGFGNVHRRHASPLIATKLMKDIMAK